jgi:hypothetical protein
MFYFFRKEARRASLCLRWLYTSQAALHTTVPMKFMKVSLLAQFVLEFLMDAKVHAR